MSIVRHLYIACVYVPSYIAEWEREDRVCGSLFYIGAHSPVCFVYKYNILLPCHHNIAYRRKKLQSTQSHSVWHDTLSCKSWTPGSHILLVVVNRPNGPFSCVMRAEGKGHVYICNNRLEVNTTKFVSPARSAITTNPSHKHVRMSCWRWKSFAKGCWGYFLLLSLPSSPPPSDVSTGSIARSRTDWRWRLFWGWFGGLGAGHPSVSAPACVPSTWSLALH